MNKTILILSLVGNVALGYLYFSSKKESPAPESAPVAQKFGLSNARSNGAPPKRMEDFDVALGDISNYFNKVVAKSEDSSFLRSFVIPSIDMLQVMGLDTNTTVTYTGANVYLGMSEAHGWRMYMTPVDSLGDDIYLSRKEGATAEPDSSSFLLDLFAPCPNLCKQKNKLYIK